MSVDGPTDVSGGEFFHVLQDLAISDSHGEGRRTNNDPLTLSKEEFLAGCDELNLDEALAAQLWDMISGDKYELTAADFDLTELCNIEEATSANVQLMSQFVHMLQAASQSTPPVGDTEQSATVQPAGEADVTD